MARELRRGGTLILFDKQNGICAICKNPMTVDLGRHNTVTIDHIIPRSRMTDVQKRSLQPGGNRQAACYKCNHDKGDSVENLNRKNTAMAIAFEKARMEKLND